MMLLLAAFALAGWIALFVLYLRPNHQAFRATVGLNDRIDAAPSLRSRLVLRAEGLKVHVFAFVASMVPILAPLYDQVTDVDWTKYLPDEQARIIAFIVLAAGIVGPMMFSGFHSKAVTSAAKIEPATPPEPDDPAA